MVIIKQTFDFEVTGNPDTIHWSKTEWNEIPFLLGNGKKAETKVRLLYSNTGIYVFFYCEDDRLTATLQQNNLELWNEDVVEVFFQPNSTQPNYFEYEISPLNFELPLIIYNDKGKLNRWIPYHLTDIPGTRHAALVQRSPGQTGTDIISWTAEFFIPFGMMKPVMDELPHSGVRWKGNLYRVDYDHQKDASLWALYKNSGNFHEYDNFGLFYFE